MDNGIEGNIKEIYGIEAEVVWTCGAKRRTLYRKGVAVGGRTGEDEIPKIIWFDKVKDGIKGKGLSADEMYDRATCRQIIWS